MKKILGIFTVILAFALIVPGISLAYKDISGFTGANSFYTGSARFSGETCALSGCHEAISTQDKFGLQITGMEVDPVNPTNLYFDPAGNFPMQVTLIPDSTIEEGYTNDQNGFVIEILDSNNQPVGTFTKAIQTELASSNSIIVDGDSPSNPVTSWTFSWAAPASVSGLYTLYFAGVDGDGDGTESGDLVETAVFTLVKQNLTETPSSGGCGIVSSTVSWVYPLFQSRYLFPCLCLLSVLLLSLLKRRV